MQTLSKTTTQRILFGVVALIILLFAQPVVTAIFIKRFNIPIDAAVFFLTRLFYWALLLGLWFYARQVEKQNLVLWQETKYDFAFYLVSLTLIFITVIIGISFVRIITNFMHFNVKSVSLDRAMKIFKAHKYLAIFTALTAGVTEELIFRAYLQPRFELLFKNSFLAIFISSLLFGLLHFGYGTVINMAGPFIIGLVYALHYQKYKNIKILIISHFLWDVLVILISINRH